MAQDDQVTIKNGTSNTEVTEAEVLTRNKLMVEQACASLLRYVNNVLSENTNHDARLYTEYSELLNVGIVNDRIVLAAEDGTSFTVRVTHDTYASLSNWQRIAVARASSLGHEVGDWEWAGSFGYINSCRHCMGLMVVSTEKPPAGEVFYRTCPRVSNQIPFDYGEAGPHDEL